jgi:hypothetical protein
MTSTESDRSGSKDDQKHGWTSADGVRCSCQGMCAGFLPPTEGAGAGRALAAKCGFSGRRPRISAQVLAAADGQQFVVGVA